MKMQEKLEKAIYNASMKAISETGDSYKRISWFTRNKENENDR